MPVGIIINVAAVVLGGLLGSLFGDKLPEQIKSGLTTVFGLMLALLYSARLILPLTTEVMINDFKACGGIILLATGFTIMKIKEIPVANMILSMVIVMPVSAFWTNVLLPLLQP